MDPRQYKRNLPHIQPPYGPFFIVFRLDGSLPVHVLEKLRKERDNYFQSLEEDFKQGKITSLKLEAGLENARTRYFKKYDQLLDNPRSGPVWLKNKKIASVVADAIHYLDGKDYELICYCIMSNHVHLMVCDTSRVLFRVLQSLKRHTGREANKILNRQGNSFWKKESYDNLVRTEPELINKIQYVLNNPVKAGLAKHWEEWPFTFCRKDYLELIG